MDDCEKCPIGTYLDLSGRTAAELVWQVSPLMQFDGMAEEADARAAFDSALAAGSLADALIAQKGLERQLAQERAARREVETLRAEDLAARKAAEAALAREVVERESAEPYLQPRLSEPDVAPLEEPGATGPENISEIDPGSDPVATDPAQEVPTEQP